MRWLLCCGLLLGIAGGAYPAIAAQPADGPGCIGVMAEECVRWLRATMTLNENFLVGGMAHRHDTDVNSRPIGDQVVSVYAQLPGELYAFVIVLHLRPDDTVERVESNLLHDLLTVDTERLYDQSKLYDIVWRLVGRRCPGIGKLDLYRFVENSVKPRIIHQRRDFSSGINGLHRITSHAAGVPYCGGVALGYTHIFEWRGSKDLEAAAKVTESVAIELQ